MEAQSKSFEGLSLGDESLGLSLESSAINSETSFFTRLDTNPKNLCFLDLPREIRDQIYVEALCAPHPLYPISPPELVDKIYPEPRTVPCANLLVANRQVHNEASPVLYEQNTFAFLTPIDLRAFEDSAVGPTSKLRQIRHILLPMRIAPPAANIPHGRPRPEPAYYWDLKPAMYWARALHLTQLSGVQEMTITWLREDPFGDVISSGGEIPAVLVKAVHEVLGAAVQQRPRLRLVGYAEEEREKFPDSWQVDIEGENRSTFQYSDFLHALGLVKEDRYWPLLRDMDYSA